MPGPGSQRESLLPGPSANLVRNCRECQLDYIGMTVAKFEDPQQLKQGPFCFPKEECAIVPQNTSCIVEVEELVVVPQVFSAASWLGNRNPFVTIPASLSWSLAPCSTC